MSRVQTPLDGTTDPLQENCIHTFHSRSTLSEHCRSNSLTVAATDRLLILGPAAASGPTAVHVYPNFLSAV